MTSLYDPKIFILPCEKRLSLGPCNQSACSNTACLLKTSNFEWMRTKRAISWRKTIFIQLCKSRAFLLAWSSSLSFFFNSSPPHVKSRHHPWEDKIRKAPRRNYSGPRKNVWGCRRCVTRGYKERDVVTLNLVEIQHIHVRTIPFSHHCNLCVRDSAHIQMYVFRWLWQ